MSLSVQQSSALDGLPKQFVSALSTLFDLLDDRGTGLVKLSDIENRWQDDGSKGLPKGVIESLRKVTPPDGLLTFERFCAGLKICLLRNQMENRRSADIKSRDISQPIRPPSAPLLDMDNNNKDKHENKPLTPIYHQNSGVSWSTHGRINLPTQNNSSYPIRNSGIDHQQRTLSMPQLPQPHIDINDNNSSTIQQPQVKSPFYGPPKPPRTAIGIVPPQIIDKAEIRVQLHNWQRGLMLEEEVRNLYSSNQQSLVRQRAIGDEKITVEQSNQQMKYKKTEVRREPRRHTLQNGVDYNMLKRMKQIEVEKEVLMQGLDAIDRAREWYLKQIATIQEKITYVGKMGYSEQWTDAQDERLELQRVRILEVNRHLANLTDPGERGGLPLHMNLAIGIGPNSAPHIVSRLRQENQYLSQEVNKKNERITSLEREKASLIRELFHIRAKTERTQPR